MPYQVLENNQPCDSKHFDVPSGNGWDNSKFSSWNEAKEYVKKWAGKLYDGLIDKIQPDKKIELYQGDFITIKSITWDEFNRKD